jgi:hypothetical protein
MNKAKPAAAVVVSALLAGVFACGGEDESAGSPGGFTGGNAASSGGGTAGDGGPVIVGDGAGGITVPDSGPVGDGFNPDAACASSTVSATLTPANILFVIDRSGSMNCNPPPKTTSAECEAKPKKADPTKPSKWEITRDALKSALTQLKTTNPLPSIGIAYFNNDDLCGYPNQPDVDVKALAQAHADAISTSLDLVMPLGATPIVGATMRGYAYMWKNAASFTGNKFVVLLTDGGETCDPSNKPLLVSKATEAVSVGIRTFVLGGPGSEPHRAFLSQVAFNGGTASSATCDHSGAKADVGDCHMDMTAPGMDFAAELKKNLDAISGKVLSCEFDVPKPPDGGTVDTKKVNVVYTPGSGTPQTLPYDDTHPCNDDSNTGWQYAANNTKIVLCGKACKAVKGDTKAKVSIALGCETTVIPK